MGNNEAVDVAFATSARTWVVSADLEVFERAVPQGDVTGQVCPNPGGTGFGAVTSRPDYLSTRTGVAMQAAGIASVIAMFSVRLSKPRTGYHASSGTG
jgi:hypothetical protein